MYENGTRSLDLLYEWSQEKMVEVSLSSPDDFLRIRETLTRIGIVGKRLDPVSGKSILTQSCHLLHKRGKYYIVHFKELFCLDGRSSDLTIGDIERRNLIVGLLAEWSLLTPVTPSMIALKAPLSAVRVVSYKDKQNFVLQAKYQIGNKK